MPLAMVYAGRFINGHTAAVGAGLRRIRTVPCADGANTTHAWMVVGYTASCHDSFMWNAA
ncbi:hypothetical protein [Paenibacillus woosongensis]|uniref:hypothetical protein n=1 Tax=Paenibacillus woosongensis TaxID=307580 RepID=UPI001BCAA670|nr:hypothetical protein [Paenibacillus woosongensis]